MKKIVSKAIVVLFIILIAVSICVTSSLDYMKGLISIQNTIINNVDNLDAIVHLKIKVLPYKLNSLFYIAIVLILVSSIVNFSKSNKIKNSIIVILSFIPSIFVLITHNYIWFLILLNLYMILFLLFDFTIKSKVNICANIIAIIITILNVTQLIRHLNLEFNPSNLRYFEKHLIYLSGITLKILLLWFIPFTILLINDTITTLKQHKNYH